MGGADSADAQEGRVEICNNLIWGTVCDDHGANKAQWGFISDVNAGVVCRQLGFAFLGAQPFILATFGQGTGPILLDEVNCDGTETRLVDCLSASIDEHDCEHNEDVGVRCEISS